MRDRDQVKNSPTEPPPRFTCPTCKRPLRVSKEGSAKLPRFFPFCSERCKMVDLGAWFDADYRIPARPDEESEESAGGDSPLGPEPPRE